MVSTWSTTSTQSTVHHNLQRDLLDSPFFQQRSGTGQILRRVDAQATEGLIGALGFADVNPQAVLQPTQLLQRLNVFQGRGGQPRQR